MEIEPSVIKFARRKKTFALLAVLPMLLLVLMSCLLMSYAISVANNFYILLSNGLFFVACMWFVIAAKRYYRCPVCEKVVVPTKEDGTPSEISFAIAYRPAVCPYCKAKLL